MNKHPQYFTGWAMEAYPEMTSEEMAFHVNRQIKEGANFIWLGHNNPGEAVRDKIEPGLSYALYEAYIDSSDPRHQDSIDLVNAQHRLLSACLERNIPVVLPIGYQIQMGERWNREHPEHLRRDFTGTYCNWGGISATFLSPQYQKDIIRYYEWVVKEFISRYHEIIILVNLSDEPFGGDYSSWADKEFKKHHGMNFPEALRNGPYGEKLVGKFQSLYIVNYATWSAQQWHALCPSIPSTMSFCGHHAREENHMPDVVAVFSNTPAFFHPTFDAYPRDGHFSNPVTETDVTMLIILLRQLSYLSNRHEKPYWLWTTGNSWGLGQNSEDKANISDALANQFHAVATALANGGDLRGVAIWNYNIKLQGLYNDTNPIIYDPDDMFIKLTRFQKCLRQYLGSSELQIPAESALVLPRDYGYRRIGESRQCVWVYLYGLYLLHVLAKQAQNFIVPTTLSEIADYESRFPDSIQNIIILGDGNVMVSEQEKSAFIRFLDKRISKGNIPRLFIPEKIAEMLKFKGNPELSAHLIALNKPPEELSENFWTENLKPVTQSPDECLLYVTRLNGIVLNYNLSRRELSVVFNSKQNRTLHQVDVSGNIIQSINMNQINTASVIRMSHHSISFILQNGEVRLDPVSCL